MVEAIGFILFGIVKLCFPNIFRIYYFYELFEKTKPYTKLEIAIERLFGLFISVYGFYLLLTLM